MAMAVTMMTKTTNSDDEAASANITNIAIQTLRLAKVGATHVALVAATTRQHNSS